MVLLHLSAQLAWKPKHLLCCWNFSESSQHPAAFPTLIPTGVCGSQLHVDHSHRHSLHVGVIFWKFKGTTTKPHRVTFHIHSCPNIPMKSYKSSDTCWREWTIFPVFIFCWKKCGKAKNKRKHEHYSFRIWFSYRRGICWVKRSDSVHHISLLQTFLSHPHWITCSHN